VLFMIFFFCLFSFLFFGGYKGVPPPYSTFLSCLKSLIRHPSFCFFFGLKDCRPLIEPFRGDEEVGIHAFTEGRFLPQLVFHSHVFFNLFLLCSHRRQEDAFSSSVGFRSSHLLISCRRWFYFYLVGGYARMTQKRKGETPGFIAIYRIDAPLARKIRLWFRSICISTHLSFHQ